MIVQMFLTYQIGTFNFFAKRIDKILQPVRRKFGIFFILFVIAMSIRIMQSGIHIPMSIKTMCSVQLEMILCIIIGLIIVKRIVAIIINVMTGRVITSVGCKCFLINA